MSAAARVRLAKIMSDYLLARLYGKGDCRNKYHGNFPINLDAPFNMGAEAIEPCHPELSITWMQLLARLSFTVNWQGEIPVVEMHHYHPDYDFTITAECLHSIKVEMMPSSGDARVYECLTSLLENIFEIIMQDIIRPLVPARLAQECVCLATWMPPTPPTRAPICKRKHGEMDEPDQ